MVKLKKKNLNIHTPTKQNKRKSRGTEFICKLVKQKQNKKNTQKHPISCVISTSHHLWIPFEDEQTVFFEITYTLQDTWLLLCVDKRPK